MAAEHVWRPRVPARAAAMLAAAVVAAASAWMIWEIVTGRPSGFGVSDVMAAFAGPLVAAVLFRWGQRAGIVLTGDTLTVISAVRTYRIPLHDVLTVSGGYYGLQVAVRGRRLPVTASAVQKSNWAGWTGRRTRADEVAEEILAARNRLQDAGSSPVSG